MQYKCSSLRTLSVAPVSVQGLLGRKKAVLAGGGNELLSVPTKSSDSTVQCASV